MTDECGRGWFDNVVASPRWCNGRHFCGLVGEHEIHCCSGCDDLYLDPVGWLLEERDDD